MVNSSIKNTPSDVAAAAQCEYFLAIKPYRPCLLYTSDAADERSSVDLGGRRLLKKKNKEKQE